MILYKFGEIVYKNKNNLILESYGTGYLVNVAQEHRFTIGQKMKLFLYEYKTDYYQNTYGFKDFKERLLFIDLLTIDKVGPKIAINLLEKGWLEVATSIVSEEWQTLASCPFVTDKTARLICVELKEKWSKLIQVKAETQAKQNNLNELNLTLATLGFKKHQIDLAMQKIKETDNLEKMIEDSIQIIADEQQKNVQTQ